MTDMICWLIGGLISISIYLTLSSQIIRWLFGIVILSSTVNIAIFVAGRLYFQYPAFIYPDLPASESMLANPLSQALILTAIVIGFGLLAFALILVRVIWREFNTTNSDLIQESDTFPIKEMEDKV